MKLNILYYAVHKQNKGWGAETFISDGLEKLGHLVYKIDYRANRNDLQKIHNESITNENFDLFLLQRGDGFPINIIQSMKCKKVFWASELVSRNRDQDRLLIPNLFDHIFFHSSECIKLSEYKGSCSVLLNGFSEDIYYPIIVDKVYDILFCGIMTQRRQNIINQLSQYFKINVSNKFGIELNKEINQSKIILNIHAEDFKDLETRVYEVLGSKNFLLSEKLNKDNVFKHKVDLVEYNTIQELIWYINYYLKNDRERYEIILDGYDNAIKNHTYDNRAKEILERIFN